MTEADPLIVRIPNSIKDPEERKFWRYVLKLIYDLRERTGGPNDTVSDLTQLPSKNAINALVASLDARVGVLEERPPVVNPLLSALVSRVSTLEEADSTARLLSLLNRVKDLEDDPMFLDPIAHNSVQLTGGTMSGDLLFRGLGGLHFGVMYAGAEIIVPVSDANPTEVEDASEDGWTAGQLNGVTFPTGGTEHYLSVTEPGRYLALWDMAAHTAAGGKTEVHGGFSIDGTPQRDDGETHRTVSNTTDTGAFGNNTILDCPNGTEQISLWIINDLSNDLHVEHANVLIVLIGGT